MKTQATETTATENMQTKRSRRPVRLYSAREKSQAVLALWAGRRTTSALCREMEVPWMILKTWEKRALNGILNALSPNGKQDPRNPLKLPKRLERLMEETQSPAVDTTQQQEN